MAHHGRVLLIGHRGAADIDHPENTLASVDRAFRLGADGVEVDLRVTADGRLVCLHDRSLRRAVGVRQTVATMSADELAVVRLPGDHPLPTVAELVDAVAGRGLLVLEIKSSTFAPSRRRAAVAAAAEELRRMGVTRGSDVVVSSFDRLALADVRRSAAVRTGVLTRPSVPLSVAVRWTLRGGHDEVHPHVSAALLGRPEVVRKAHAAGLSLTAWTADRAEDLHRLAARGVDAAITNDPAAARAALAADPPRVLREPRRRRTA